ncbi:MAG: hypothetical protein MUO76_22380, partial [Anaerolineaceae bacterium]|nr:hypothetical protein [Anaerolineaceae bacterium]
MKARIVNSRQILFFFCGFFLCLIMVSCAQLDLEKYFPVPTSRSFPSLTPRPTHTPTPTTTSTPTITPTSTPITPVEIGTPMAPSGRIISADNVNRLEHFVSRGKGIPQQLIFSPDGNTLAISSSHGVYLYNSVTLEEVAKFETGVTQLCISFSANGKMLASGGQDGSIRLWSIEDGSLLHFFYDGNLPIIGIAFSPGGEFFAASSWDHHIRFWGVPEGDLIQTMKVRQKATEKLAFSPDGGLLFAWANRESVQVWNAADGKVLDDLYIGND